MTAAKLVCRHHLVADVILVVPTWSLIVAQGNTALESAKCMCASIRMVVGQPFPNIMFSPRITGRDSVQVICQQQVGWEIADPVPG